MPDDVHINTSMSWQDEYRTTFSDGGIDIYHVSESCIVGLLVHRYIKQGILNITSPNIERSSFLSRFSKGNLSSSNRKIEPSIS